MQRRCGKEIHSLSRSGDPMSAAEHAGSLTKRERHPIGITVAVTKGCPEYTAGRLARAHQAQIDETAIREAVDLAAGISPGFVITAIVSGSERGN
jgi:alkylhydroperoxidase/carboxymuconolactone decarboxylase family protein YurZ